MNATILTWVIALIGSAGLGGFLREIIDGWMKLRSGMAAREGDLRDDIAQDRDRLRGLLDAAERARDDERARRRQAEEYAWQLQRQVYELGGTPVPWPVYERH